MSNAILSAERLPGAICGLKTKNEDLQIEDEVKADEALIVAQDGWVGVFGEFQPWIVSGKAGNYTYNGIPVAIPEDGTYAIMCYAGAICIYVASFYNTEVS